MMKSYKDQVVELIGVNNNYKAIATVGALIFVCEIVHVYDARVHFSKW